MTQTSYALVTGASHGLGRFFASALAARKHNLILIARSQDRLNRVADELKATHGIETAALPFDLATPAAGQHLAQQLHNREMHVDLLVNNAGFGDQGWFVELSLERQLQMMRLQNATVVELTHALLPAMIEQRRGGIINVSSMAGFQPIPFAAIYSATKSFLTTFSLALEAEVQRHNIAVVTICPGRLQPDPTDSAETRAKVPGGEQSHDQVVLDALHKLDQGGGLAIPGTMNKFAAFAERFVPRSKVARLVGKWTKPKRP